MITESMDLILQTIINKKSFLLTSHILPDGDSLGSVIALGIALEKLDKKVYYCMDSTFGEKYKFLPKSKDLLCDIPETEKEFEVGISLDCSDTNHLFNANILKRCDTIINIDHHINNTKFGDYNFIDSDAGATGEIIYHIIHSLNLPIDYDMAIALYTAIVTDTGNFKYSNTTSKTHAIVSELLKHPIEAWKINKWIFDEHPMSKILLIGRAIQNLKILLDGRLAVTTIMQKDLDEAGASSDDLDSIINIGRDIIGVEVSVLIKEINESEYKVGFRSNEYIDVAKIAYDLGGGGHKRASGCTMKGSKDEILVRLIQIISNRLK